MRTGHQGASSGILPACTFSCATHDEDDFAGLGVSVRWVGLAGRQRQVADEVLEAAVVVGSPEAQRQRGEAVRRFVRRSPRPLPPACSAQDKSKPEGLCSSLRTHEMMLTLVPGPRSTAKPSATSSVTGRSLGAHVLAACATTCARDASASFCLLPCACCFGAMVLSRISVQECGAPRRAPELQRRTRGCAPSQCLSLCGGQVLP